MFKGTPRSLRRTMRYLIPSYRSYGLERVFNGIEALLSFEEIDADRWASRHPFLPWPSNGILARPIDRMRSGNKDEIPELPHILVRVVGLVLLEVDLSVPEGSPVRRY